jgi:hypothetical protein
MTAPKKILKSSAARWFAAAAVIMATGGCYAPQPSPAESRDKAPPVSEPPAAKESIRAPVQPVPAESRTPEEAARRAADPKDPSGALIIEPPKSKP